MGGATLMNPLYDSVNPMKCRTNDNGLDVPTNRLRMQIVKYGNARRGQHRLRLRVRFVRVEFAGRALQLATEDADIARRIECQCHSIPGDPANLQDYIVSNVNPFTHFSTKNQHADNSLFVTELRVSSAIDPPSMLSRDATGRINSNDRAMNSVLARFIDDPT